MHGGGRLASYITILIDFLRKYGGIIHVRKYHVDFEEAERSRIPLTEEKTIRDVQKSHDFQVFDRAKEIQDLIDIYPRVIRTK